MARHDEIITLDVDAVLLRHAARVVHFLMHVVDSSPLHTRGAKDIKNNRPGSDYVKPRGASCTLERLKKVLLRRHSENENGS